MLSPGPTPAVGGPPASWPSFDGCSTNSIVQGSTSTMPSTTENTNCRPCRRQPSPNRAAEHQRDADQQTQRRGEREQHGLTDPGEPCGPPTSLDDHPPTPRDRVHSSTEQRQHDRRHARPEPPLRDRPVREHRQPVRRGAPRPGDSVDDESTEQGPRGQGSKGNRAEQQEVRRAGRPEGHRRQCPELSEPGRRGHPFGCGSGRVPERTETVVRREHQVRPEHAAADQAAGGHDRRDGKEDPRRPGTAGGSADDATAAGRRATRAVLFARRAVVTTCSSGSSAQASRRRSEIVLPVSSRLCRRACTERENSRLDVVVRDLVEAAPVLAGLGPAAGQHRARAARSTRRPRPTASCRAGTRPTGRRCRSGTAGSAAAAACPARSPGRCSRRARGRVGRRAAWSLPEPARRSRPPARDRPRRRARRRPGSPPGSRASRSRCRRGTSAAAGRNPCSVSQTSRRTSIPAELTASTLRDLVVLALVELAGLDAGVAAAAERGGDADLEQFAVARPEPQLRAPDAGLRRHGGLQQQLFERLRCRRAVVVQQPQPLHAPACGRRRRTGRRPTGWARSRPPPGRGRPPYRSRSGPTGRPRARRWASRPSSCGGLVGGAGVDGDQPLGAPLERPQGLGQPGQPGGALVPDHDRGDDMPDRRATHRVVGEVGREIDGVEEFPAGRSFGFHAEQ